MLNAPVNITTTETKKIKAELLKFFHYWLLHKKGTNVLDLESQFIGLDKVDLPAETQAPVLYDILRRLKIYDAWHMLCFIVVSDSKEFPIHIDDIKQTWTAVGLNIPVLNCHDSKTVWYDSIPEVDSIMPNYMSSLSKYGNLATKCTSIGVNEIGSCDANIPHWVNYSVPHAPVCNHKKLRINSSLRFQFDCKAEDFFIDPRYQHCFLKTVI